MDGFQVLAFAAIGMFTGFMSGLFGIGGGSVRVPLLTLTGMPLINAFATNMVAIPFSSTTGAVVQRKNIHWKIVKYFTPAAVIAIIIATFLVGIVSSTVLAILFFFAALVTVFGLYLDRISHKLYDKIRPTAVNLFSGAFIGNLIIGMRGGSGGTLFPPILRAMHVEMHHAIATSLFTGVFASFAALVMYYFRGDIVFLPAVIVGVTDVFGAYLGSKHSLHTRSSRLRLGLAVLVVLLACLVLFRALFGF